jgi:hypothetical protein
MKLLKEDQEEGEIKMNKNLLYIAAFAMCFVFALSLISANVILDYNVYESIQEEDGDYIESTIPVDNFEVAGYICDDADCNSIDSQFLDTSATNGYIRIDFPTTDVNQFFGVYFYSDEWIHWEEGLTLVGTEPATDPLDTYDIYLTKKEVGYAPIMGLNVINEVNPNLPIEVGVEVEIDADTYAAIENAGPLDNPGIEASFADVETLVSLEIVDEDNNVLYTDSETVDIPYSQSVNVEFTYPGFADTGLYEIRVETEVTDAKILNSDNQEASTEVNVVPFASTDYAYTLVQNLEMTPVLPEEGDTVEFTVDYLSNYVDEDGDLNPIDTRIVVNLFRNGVEIDDTAYYLDESGTLTFEYELNSEASYRVVIEGEPEDADDYDTVVSDIDEMTFMVGEEDDDDDDDDSNGDGEWYLESINPLDDGTYNVIDLTPDHPSLEQKLRKLLCLLLIAILILVILIVITAIVKLR